MTAKTRGTRNPERRSGKAWSKNHNKPVKSLSEEAQARKAERDAKRSQAVRSERGSDITMPKITWEWATQIMDSRWANTRRAIMVERCIVREKNRKPEDSSLTPEPNPEAKASRSSRKNGR